MIDAVPDSCLVVDDSVQFLAAAKRLLEAQGMSVVRCASSRAEAIVVVASETLDVILVDVELGDEDGVRLASELAATSPRAGVVLISGHDQDDGRPFLQADLLYQSEHLLGIGCTSRRQDQNAIGVRPEPVPDCTEFAHERRLAQLLFQMAPMILARRKSSATKARRLPDISCTPNCKA